MAAGVEIAEVTPGDLGDLARFLTRETADADATTARDTRPLQWFLFDNPAQPPGVPRGWVARDKNGEMVGSKFCAAERFQCNGASYTLLMGGGFYVSASHRGLGLSLMRVYLELGKRHALFASTMNEVSGALYERYGGYPVPNTEHEYLGVLHYAPVVEEFLARRFGRPGLARLLASAAALRPASVRGGRGGELVRIVSPAELSTLAIDTPPEHAHEITALRDEAFLRWRYFEGPDSARALYVYRSERGERALVGVTLRPRGHRGQVRALMVLDYWGALPATEIGNVAQHLAVKHRDHADVIAFRGQPPARQAALEQAGFLRRLLPRAVGVCIDRHDLLPTRDWYMVPADGDMAR